MKTKDFPLRLFKRDFRKVTIMKCALTCNVLKTLLILYIYNDLSFKEEPHLIQNLSTFCTLFPNQQLILKNYISIPKEII